MRKFSSVLMAVCLFSPTIFLSQNTAELKAELVANTDAVVQFSILEKLVDSTLAHDLSEAQAYAERALSTAQDLGDEKMIAKANLLAGKTWIALTNYDSAGLFLQRAEAAFEQFADPVNLGEALYLQGTIAANKRELSQASAQYYLALEKWEKAGHQLGMAKVYNGLSDVAYMGNDYEDAIKFGDQAIAILEQLDEPLTLANAHDNMAYNHLFRGEYDESLEHVYKALELVKNADAKAIDLARIYNTRGNILKNIDRYDEALEDYQNNLALCEKAGSERGIMVSKGNIGHTLRLKGDYAAALPFTLEAIEMMKSSGDLRNLWENYMHASESYAGLGDYKNANRYTWLYAEEVERTYEEELTQLESELAEKYETGKRDATIVLQQEQIKQQTTRQWLIGGIAGLLALVGALLFWGFRQKQKSNAALEKANGELEKKNAENELLLKEIHHRVKNNLQTISSLLNLQSASIEDASALAAVQESQSRVRSMALIHQKLYQGEKLAAVEMKDYFETMGEAMLETFGRQAEKVELDVQMTELELDVDTAIPLGLIANELLTNSLKYAFPGERKGKIEVSLTTENKDELCFKIADDGVGLLGENQDNSFGPGTGFGGRLVQLLTMQLGGKLEQKGEGGTATIIRFKPLAKAA